MKGKGKIKIIVTSVTTLLIICAIVLSTIVRKNVNNTTENFIDPELTRSMNYTQITDEDSKVDNCDYVQFSAFFTRDLDGDGNAEKLLGTCRNITDKDVLYMDLNVLSDGYLKDGKITINGTNFNYSMNMVKDTVLKNNYISNNVKQIELNDVNAGTQKLILGNVIANIGNDTNNYSKISSVTLTGTHVSDEGIETPISKTIDLTVDWYGTTRASLSSSTVYYNYDNLNTTTISFNVTLNETQTELILKDNVATVTIPELKGYAPTEVKCTSSNVESEYNEETRVLTLKRSSKCNEQGVVTSTLSRSNTYGISVTYPQEAYDAISSYTTLTIPITGYYTGYNNQNEEFQNPYMSNIVNGNINIVFRETPKGSIYNFYVDFMDKKYNFRYYSFISKQYLLNLYDSEDEIENKEYVVRWQAVRGSEGEVSSMIMSETKQGESYGDQWANTIMENYVSNTGIYFSNANNFLEENGTISVYNNDTNELIKTFTKEEWNTYTREKPYKYEEPVQHIRVETSSTNLNSSLSVYNVKELDVNKVIQDFTKDEVKNINIVYTYLTGICNIVGQSAGTVKDIDYAYYISDKSYTNISVGNSKLSTQETLNNEKIYIEAVYNGEGDAKWQNGEFLVEIPEQIINMEINSVNINNQNVEIVAYDLYQKDGKYFIKIITENEEPTSYKITIDCNITPDPRSPTSNANVKLYASNKYCNDYYSATTDIYDVDGDNNTQEQIGTDYVIMSFSSPTSLITLETVSNYNEENEITIAPNVAEVERETRQANINIGVTNNYPNTVSGMQILGKIPFEGNSYIINGKTLNSKFTTTMTNTGIQVPDELKEKTVVYYSANENPTKDIDNPENGWKTIDKVEDFSEIKTYLIDLAEYTIKVGKEYNFTYTINIPENINYNLASYSNHAVYYELNTEGGNLVLSTEPNKVGVRIVKKFDLELTKYKINSSVVIPSVTYSLKYDEENENGDIVETTRILTTNTEGKISLKNLYAEKTYKLQEIKVPDTCEFNSEEVVFTVNADGTVTFAEDNNSTLKDYTFQNGEILQINLEDEVKYNVEISKTKIASNVQINGVRFTLRNSSGDIIKSVATADGMATFEGLSLNTEYTIKENSTPGNCELNEGVFTFKLIRENGVTKLVTITNTLTTGTPVLLDLEDVLTPVVKARVENEIKYSLELVKQDKNGDTLKSIQFKIKGKGFNTNGNTFKTSEEGKISISGLSFGENYVIEETNAIGYYLDSTKDNTIQFRVDRVGGSLQLTTWTLGDGIVQVGTQSLTEEDLTAILSVVLENEKVPTYNLNIVKVNEDDEQLAGAQFKLTSLDTLQEQIITVDENGEGTFENLYEYIDGKCVTGEYILEEIYAPKGYGLNTKQLKFKASRDENGIVQITLIEGEEIIKVKAEDSNSDEDGSTSETSAASDDTSEKEITSDENSVTLNIVNKPIFRITKYGDNDILLPNVKFVITDLEGNPAKDVNGEIVGTEEVINGVTYNVVTTNEKGEISVDLPEGLYAALEVQTTEGYYLPSKANKRIYYFEIGESKPTEEEFQLAWAKSTTSELSSKLKSVVPTDDGGTIVIGTIYGDTDLNEDGTIDVTGKGYRDGIIIKYSKDGEIEWSKSFGGEYDDELLSIAIDPTGGYVIAGYTNSKDVVTAQEGNYNKEVTLGDTVIDAVEFGNEDGIVVKIDNSGNYVWSQVVGGTGTDKINSVAVSDSGDVAVVGSYFSNVLYLERNKTDSLTNCGEKDGFISVYSNTGAYRWSQNIGGTQDDWATSVTSTGSGFAVTANFMGTTYADTAKTEDFIATGMVDGFLINYTANGAYSWGKQIGSSSNDVLSQVIADDEGNIIVAGSYGNSVNISSDETIATKGIFDGLVVKYSASGKYLKHITIGGTQNETISSIATTDDGGLLFGGWYYSTAVDLNNDGTNEITSNSGECDGLIAKLDENYELEWFDTINGNSYDEVTGITQSLYGGYVAVGDFESSSLTVFNQSNKLSNTKLADGFAIKYHVARVPEEIPKVQEFDIHNNLLEYKITTEIGLNSGDERTGGTITGMYNDEYLEKDNIKFVESVKHDYDSSEVIEIKSANDYYITEITVNGEAIEFTLDENGNVILPSGYFTNVTENKHIVVTFEPANILIINKVDEDDPSIKLSGAKFKIEHIVDVDPNDLIGEMQPSAISSYTTHNFVKVGDKYESTNQGVSSSSSNSYFPIDLREYTGTFTLIVNASVSSESVSYDMGYATITTSTTVPTHSESSGQFIKIGGTSVATQDYSTTLSGGQLYYLHIGYRKDGSVNNGDDKFTINSIRLTTEQNLITSEEIVTDENGQASIRLQYNKNCTITEIEAPFGYELDSTSQNVTIEEGEIKNITITNKQGSNIPTIVKVDKDTKKPIPGVKFAIYSVAEGHEKNEDRVLEMVTDENGKIEPRLTSGYYKAVETEVPEGYVLEEAEELRTTYFKTEGIVADFEINYIEDLVELSNQVNSGTDYSGKVITLKRTLDFNDESSYRNASDTTTYGDYNGDGTIETIKEELTKVSGSGFKPIGAENQFNGIFDGNGFEIKNLYVNNTTYNNVGLFGCIKNATVCNLSASGTVKSNISNNKNGYTGGIVAFANNSTIINCSNKTQVTGKVNWQSMAGGIAGHTYNSTIWNCNNEGMVSGSNSNQYNSFVGGITGGLQKNASILNCYNKADISSSSTANRYWAESGGITALINEEGKIINSYNEGNVTSKQSSGGVLSGGIVGNSYAVDYNVLVKNCYNKGTININGTSSQSSYVGGIIGQAYSKTILENSYNSGNISSSISTSYIGAIIGYSIGTVSNTNIYWLNTTASKGVGVGTDTTKSVTQEQISSEKILAQLNFNNGTTNWIIADDGYPTLDFKNVANVYLMETSDIVIKNSIIQCKINTKVEKDASQEKDGGTITGQGEEIYEVVNYNENSVEDIIVQPDEGYEIGFIKINGEEITFEPDENGNVLLNKFEHMIEDKEIIVKFLPIYENNFTLKKVDKYSNEPIQGVKFAIYNMENNDFAKDKSGRYIGTKNEDGTYIVTTDNNGKIEVNLPEGHYKAIEIETVEGYKRKDEPTYFSVGETTTETKADITINYIEDLVDLSNAVNSGTNYSGKTIVLARNLDFNSDSSYRNPNDTSYGDYNGNGTTEGIKAELTNTSYKGFKPIGIGSGYYFVGTFNGNGNEIKNIYINNSSYAYAGLFGYVSGAIIKDVGITGTIKSTYSSGYSYLGGIAGCVYSTTINNCYSKAYITNTKSGSGNLYTGGIIGYSSGWNYKIKNCYNTGSIYNYANYTESGYNSYVGGISGYAYTIIEDCYNKGYVYNSSKYAYAYTGGISGYAYTIKNSYNAGSMYSNNSNNSSYSYKGGIAGSCGSSVTNAYWISYSATQGIGNNSSNNDTTSLTNTEMYSKDFVKQLNNYQESAPVIEWKHHINAYPTFTQIDFAEENEITITNHKIDKFTITKLDEKTQSPIPNVKFVIYSLDEIDFAKDYNENYIGTKEGEKYISTTDENGQINLYLKPGHYKAVEIESAEGYILEEDEDSRTTYFEIDYSNSQSEIEPSDADVIINNIEDLVRLSNAVNSGTSYKGKTVVLARTLDFNENSSYNNPNDISFGDYNENGNSTEGIKQELITGNGFRSIGYSQDKPFKGTFNGNGYEIKNINICNYDSKGLFGYIESGAILNLGITGEMKAYRRGHCRNHCISGREYYNK